MRMILHCTAPVPCLELVALSNDAHHPTGAPEGKGGQFAPKYNAEQEQANGEDAMRRALHQQADVPDAMKVRDFGMVDFRWGTKDLGIAHIQARAEQRLSKFQDDLTPETVLTMMPRVLAYGKLTSRAVNKAMIEMTDDEGRVWRATLGLNTYRSSAVKNAWLLSGYDVDEKKGRR